MRTQIHKRGERARVAVGLSIAVAVLVSGCAGQGPEQSTDSSEDQVTLRFAWWGSDLRNQRYLDIIDEFEKENPGITITPEYGEYTGFWDKLATQYAANDAPDIIQFEDIYLREYSSRGLLLDLSDYGVDTSQIDDAVLAAGTTEDGLVGFPMGLSAPVIFSNPTLLSEGEPDYSTWTWDEYASFAEQRTADGVFGSNFPPHQGMFNIWFRQHGASLYGEGGGIGFDASDLAGYFEFLLGLSESGAIPSAELTTEDLTASAEENLVASNRVALAWQFTNNTSNLSSSAGQTFGLNYPPSAAGSVEDAGLWYKVAFEAVNASTAHPDEAAKFVDFVANSEVAGKISLVERGVPVNAQVREAIKDDLPEADQISVDYIERISEYVSPTPIPPAGAAAIVAILDRYSLDVMYERYSPEEAADSALAEIQAEL